MRRDSINLNQTLIRQRKLFINSICQILWRPDHKVLAKMAILTETLLRFSGFFSYKGKPGQKMCEKAKYGVCTNHYSDVTCIKLLFQLYIHSSIHLSVRPSPIIISQKAVGQLFRTSFFLGGGEKKKRTF